MTCCPSSHVAGVAVFKYDVGLDVTGQCSSVNVQVYYVDCRFQRNWPVWKQLVTCCPSSHVTLTVGRHCHLWGNDEQVGKRDLVKYLCKILLIKTVLASFINNATHSFCWCWPTSGLLRVYRQRLCSCLSAPVTRKMKMCQQSRAGEFWRNVTIRDRLTVQDYSWLCLCCLLLNAALPCMLSDFCPVF